MLNVLFVVGCGMNVMGVALGAGIVTLWLIREKKGGRLTLRGFDRS